MNCNIQFNLSNYFILFAILFYLLFYFIYYFVLFIIYFYKWRLFGAVKFAGDPRMYVDISPLSICVCNHFFCPFVS